MALLAWRGLRLEGWLWDEGEALAGMNKGSEECPMPPAQGEQVLELTGALGIGGG